ncbi:LysR family transcriptional regulator [Paraburkholderia youngii]|uniref:LysR family transcriptional regulator n=1 Tax=Paraburkholderia youngii TaxID=2782701 RepID=A0A7Y6MWW0_9BURK|nr:LysR family transcriptional regulator [Paraburkholderia youngii]NUX99116.1 LysR family transcriptional regulator [Paraburkholderia youngii]
MHTIPQKSESDLELDLHHLQVFDVLLTEHSLTKAARVLNLSQPALSKTLARLRLYFGDPLFVRVGLRMEPTPKALELSEPVRSILKNFRALRSEYASFDPKMSTRKFSFFLVDAGAIKIFPALLNYLAAEAPGICVQSIPCDAQHLDLWLESGLVDLAIGSFPSLTMGIRRVPLWTESYVSVTRRDHPRIGSHPSKADFIAEKHALVSALGTGHEHLAVERLIESQVPSRNIVCRVPVFTSAALIAKHSDVIATVPRSLAVAMCRDLDLQLVEPPIELPRLEIAQYWHDRCHLEPGNQWLRNTFRKLFSTRC